MALRWRGPYRIVDTANFNSGAAINTKGVPALGARAILLIGKASAAINANFAGFTGVYAAVQAGVNSALYGVTTSPLLAYGVMASATPNTDLVGANGWAAYFHVKDGQPLGLPAVMFSATAPAGSSPALTNFRVDAFVLLEEADQQPDATIAPPA